LAAGAQLGGIAEVTLRSFDARLVSDRPRAVDLVVRALGAQIFLINHAFSDV
jgi:hypothetical protein